MTQRASGVRPAARLSTFTSMRSFLTFLLWFAFVGLVDGAPPPAVTALAFHPEGKLLAAGSYGEVALIDPAKGEVIGKLPGQTQRVTALAFSKDGSQLAVASGRPSKDGQIRLYRFPKTGLPTQPSQEWSPHSDVIYTLAFSPDGELLASAGYDRIIRLRSAADPEQRHGGLTDHSDTVYCLAFHPRGKLLASVSADRAVKVWDVESKKRLYTLSDPTDWVYTVAWSPDGKLLAAAGVDKSIRVWEASAEGARLVQSVFAHTQ